MVLSEAVGAGLDIWSGEMMNQSQPSYPDLSKVTMLVTGANGGIGIDIVESALGAGAHVLATDLVIEEKLEAMNYQAPERIPTKKPRAAKENILQTKKKQSIKKQLRQKPAMDD